MVVMGFDFKSLKDKISNSASSPFKHSKNVRLMGDAVSSHF